MKRLYLFYILIVLFSWVSYSQAKMILNKVSCSAVTTTGACTTIDFTIPGAPVLYESWSVVVTGSPTTVNVNLEGSLNNTNWFTLDSSTATTSEMRHVSWKGIVYIRGNVTTLTGGTTPTVTVQVAGFE